MEGVGDDPWLVLGDFNNVQDPSKVNGTSGDISNAMEEFQDCIRSTGLLDLPMQVCLCSTLRTSDHSLLVLQGYAPRTSGHLFCFDNFLATAPGFIVLVQGVWRHDIHGTPMYAITRKLKALKPMFRAKRKEKGDLSDNVSKAQQFLDIVQHLLSVDRHSDLLLTLERVARLVLQKASKFELIHAFFENLLGGHRQHRPLDINFLRPWAQHVLTAEEAASLVEPIQCSEVKMAIFAIEEDTTPGPDGFSVGFYKAAWPVIGNDITVAVHDFFITGRRISHNIQLVQELFSGYNRRNLPPRCALKECLSTAAYSVSFNGKLHGFFKGARGLRQGGPISPYLFVLAMEVLHLLLLQRVEQSEHFQFYRLCKDVDLLSLCFVDDLLLFCKANEHSVMLFRDGLQLFAEWSGLQANVSRPTNLSDCRPLITEVEEHLAGWGNLTLSFARIQLIKSVVSALNTYWAMTFILAKGVIQAIEARMRKFLWQGGTGTGMAKVAWSDVCRLLEEGGQGVRALHPLNKRLMCKHLWDVVQRNSESIWLIDYIRCTVGTGATLTVWQDPWHPFGVLIYRFPRGQQVTGIPLEAQLSVVIQNGPYRIARNCFLLWLAILEKLSTLDRAWWQGQDQSCVLCTRGIAETHDHLFFQCDYSRQCLQILRSKVRFFLPFRTWRPNVDWAARRWRGRHPLNAACRAFLASLVYHIWMEWNQRYFSSKTSTPDHTAMLCIEQIRGRLLGDDLKLSVSTAILFRI
ncbi:UNVERIFIED_CONTAM: putative ribonuclease H protein [Sesamum latifolium]|uniref:Ribonuclease H protein n=1 Tax=Sesamum latifolium TaxID=2727402 RepID=A0AAW2UFH2_9LAMI